MKKLLIILLLLASGLTHAQVSTTFDRIFRQNGGRGLSQKNYSTTDSLLNRDNATKIVSLSTTAAQAITIGSSATQTAASALATANQANLLVSQLAANETYSYTAKPNSQTLIQVAFEFNASSVAYTSGSVLQFSASITPVSNVKQIKDARFFVSNTASPVVTSTGTQYQSITSLTVTNGTPVNFQTAVTTFVVNNYIRVFVGFELTNAALAGQISIANVQLTVAGQGTPKIPGTGLFSPNASDTYSTITGGSSVAASGPVSATLSLDNAEKIVAAGNSYWDAIGVLKDKAPASVLSGLSEYNWANFSLGGRSAEVIATDITTSQKRYSSTYTYAMLRPTYSLISDNQNAKSVLNQTDSAYYANTQTLINTVRGLGIEPILPTEAGGWFAATRDGEQRNLTGLKALADINNMKFIDVVTRSRIFNTTYNPRFWKTNHPATRTTWLIIDGIRKGLKNSVPRPRQSLKIFRVRGTVTVGTTADLLFRTIPERYLIWKEISIGHTALAESVKMKYDTVSGLYDANQTINDEYLSLRGGNSIALGTYALVDAVLPVSQPTGLSVVVSDTSSALALYARKLTSTGSSWVAVAGSKGVFVLPDGSGLTDYDKATFLLTKTAGITLSSIYLSWLTGTPKTQAMPVTPQNPKGAELLAETMMGTSTQLASWSVTGGASYTASPDGVLPVSTTGLTEISTSAGLSQTFTAPASDDPLEIVIRVWARRWVPFFSQLANFTTAPITYETPDIGNLIVNISGTTGQSLSQNTDVVGLHWSELEFRVLVPPNSTSTTRKIQILSKDVPLQIAKVSIRTVTP